MKKDKVAAATTTTRIPYHHIIRTSNSPVEDPE
jgi:hypothetical protein